VLYKCETPHNGGASRNSLVGPFRDPNSPSTLQSQFLIAQHRVRPELASVIAALAFEGGAQ